MSSTFAIALRLCYWEKSVLIFNSLATSGAIPSDPSTTYWCEENFGGWDSRWILFNRAFSLLSLSPHFHFLVNEADTTKWFASTGAKVTSLEINPKHRDVAVENCKGLDVEVILGDAGEILPKLQSEGQIFDMMFIDADWERQAAYFEWGTKLVRKGVRPLPSLQSPLNTNPPPRGVYTSTT